LVDRIASANGIDRVVDLGDGYIRIFIGFLLIATDSTFFIFEGEVMIPCDAGLLAEANVFLVALLDDIPLVIMCLWCR